MTDPKYLLGVFFEMDNETVFYATGLDTRPSSDEAATPQDIVTGFKYDDGDIYEAWAYPHQLRWTPTFIEPAVRRALKRAAR